MKNFFLCAFLLLSIIAKSQVNSITYNDLTIRNTYVLNTFSIQTPAPFNTAMQQIYNYNVGGNLLVPSLATILAQSTYTANGVVYFNDLTKTETFLNANLKNTKYLNAKVLLGTLTKFRNILNIATDYASFKVLITAEINSSINLTQIAFYNQVLATGDLLEARESIISTTGENVLKCKNQTWWQCWGKCTFGIISGAGLGGLAGAASGSSVPVLGTVGGGIVGVILGGMGGATTACN